MFVSRPAQETAPCFSSDFGFCHHFQHRLWPVDRPRTIYRPGELGNAAPAASAFRRQLLYLCLFSSILKMNPFEPVFLFHFHGQTAPGTLHELSWGGGGGGCLTGIQVQLSAVQNCIKIQLLMLLTAQQHLQTSVYSSPTAVLSSPDSSVFSRSFIRVTEIIRTVGRI